MAVTGIAQAASVIISIVRMKALALMLGPAGLGVLSLFNSLQGTASSVAGLGLVNSGVRQIAQAEEGKGELSRVRHVLLSASITQGAIAMVAIWFLREPIGAWLFGSPGHGTQIGMVGVAVLLTLVAGSQTALLRGMRRIGDLGRVTVLGALAGTAGGIAAVWMLGTDGLVWFVLLQPLTAVLVAMIYTRKLPIDAPPRADLSAMWQQWKPMVRLGAVFMLGGLATPLALLLARTRIVSELGLDAAGQFAAAWGISITYVGFLLTAIGLDYYPQLAEIIRDRKAASRLMNEQTQISLLVGGPVLLLLIGLAPAVITILYSDQFGEAVALLQWQTAGNVFKLAGWSIGFAFAAAANSRVYLFSQLHFNALYLGLVWFGLPLFGLEIMGYAFLAASVVHIGVLHILARRVLDFSWEPLTLALIAVYSGLSLALLPLSLAFPPVGASAAVVLFLATGFGGGHILLEKIGPSLRTAPLARIYAACGWPIGGKA